MSFGVEYGELRKELENELGEFVYELGDFANELGDFPNEFEWELLAKDLAKEFGEFENELVLIRFLPSSLYFRIFMICEIQA